MRDLFLMSSENGEKNHALKLKDKLYKKTHNTRNKEEKNLDAKLCIELGN
jgi:hypothetical protein